MPWCASQSSWALEDESETGNASPGARELPRELSPLKLSDGNLPDRCDCALPPTVEGRKRPRGESTRGASGPLDTTPRPSAMRLGL